MWERRFIFSRCQYTVLVLVHLFEAARHDLEALRFRADRAVEQAVRAPIDDRRRLLGQASADYEACAGKFDGLTGYHDAEKVLAYCQGRRTVVQRLLQQMNELAELPKPGAPDASSDR